MVTPSTVCESSLPRALSSFVEPGSHIVASGLVFTVFDVHRLVTVLSAEIARVLSVLLIML